MIRYDRSPASIVVTCTCGWREIALTKEGAWRVASHHEAGTHPGRYQVRGAEAKRRKREDEEEDRV